MYDVHIYRLGKFRSGACNLPDYKRHRGGYKCANDANICVFAIWSVKVTKSLSFQTSETLTYCRLMWHWKANSQSHCTFRIMRTSRLGSQGLVSSDCSCGH